MIQSRAMWIELALEQERKKREAVELKKMDRLAIIALAICTIGAEVIVLLNISAYIWKLFN